jgi:hypothetical protein
MRLAHITLAAATVATALSFAVPSFAAVNFPDESRNGTTFDLGVDVSTVPLNARAVDSYIASLEPETQAAIMGGCHTYMDYPSSAKSLDTISFCRIAVGD